MKHIFSVAVAFLLLTSVVFAETSPAQKNTDQVFDRFTSLSSKYFSADAVGFLKELKNDPAVDYKIYSFKPLAMNVYFASGKAIYINGNSADFVSENGVTISDSNIGGCIGFTLLGIFLIFLGLISFTEIFTIVLIIPGILILFYGIASCFS